MEVWRRTFATAACLLLTAVNISVSAQTLPGTGKTVNFAQGDNLGGNYVAGQIMIRALKTLGYDVHLRTMNATLFFVALGHGDVDLATEVNFPQSEAAFRTVQDSAKIVGDGEIVGGGINGYLIDRKTALEHNITSLDQMKDPKVASLFGEEGQAKLISCDPGWSCGAVVDYQLDKFGLQKTVHPVHGKYEVLVADAIARVHSGKPAFFYAWSPSWMTSLLIPGKDVVWLPTPADALPPNLLGKGSALVNGVEGCAGGANPCRMAMASWNYRSVANSQFIMANPSIQALINQFMFPRATWSNWELSISRDGGAPIQIAKLADDWIAANKKQFDQWVDTARKAP